MTPEERRERIRELAVDLDDREFKTLVQELQGDIEAERRRRDWVAALLRERAGYERTGNKAGVTACDKELVRYGRFPEAAGSRNGPTPS